MPNTTYIPGEYSSLTGRGMAHLQDDESMREYEALRFNQDSPSLSTRPAFPQEDPTSGATPESRKIASAALTKMGYVPTGKPWTLDPEHDAPASISTTFAPAFKAIGTGAMETTVTPRQYFSTFYGGNNNFNTELQKAKTAYEADKKLSAYPQEQRDGESTRSLADSTKMWMDYDSVDNPVKVKVQYTEDPYLKNGKATIQAPMFAAINKRNLARDPEYAARNGYIPSDVGSKEMHEGPSLIDTNSRAKSFYDYLTHELGHEITNGPIFGSNKFGGRKQHMADPNELANQLGQIQREAYSTFGKRFSREAFGQYLKSQSGLPPEQQFQEFSTEPKRALREIIKSYKQEISPEAYKRSIMAIPYFARTDYPIRGQFTT
jgi:hypothetical protein